MDCLDRDSRHISQFLPDVRQEVKPLYLHFIALYVTRHVSFYDNSWLYMRGDISVDTLRSIFAFLPCAGYTD